MAVIEVHRCLLLFVLLLCAIGPISLASANKRVEVDPVLRAKLAQNLAQSYAHIDQFDAEVWLRVSDQRLQKYLQRQSERLELLRLVYTEATRQGLDPDLVLAVMEIESHFNRFAISRVGAQGLMQVMPFWRLEIGRPQDNLTEVATNIRYGTVILAHYIKVSDEDLVEALGRYNGSRGKLKYPDKVITAWRTHWRNKTRDELPQLLHSCNNYGLKACRYW
ncbi:MAG: transglycosylase SLT domain-containing protein [Pseudomonadota bacterium]